MPLCASRARMRASSCVVEVAEHRDVARGGLRAFDQAVVRQGVQQHVVGRPHQPLRDAEAGGPAGGIERDVLHLQELGQLGFECQRQHGVAQHGRRAGAVHAELLDGGHGGLLQLRAGGQREVVLRGEVHALREAACRVADARLGGRCGVQRAAVGPVAPVGALLPPGLEARGACEQARPGGVAVVAGGALQRVEGR